MKKGARDAEKRSADMVAHTVNSTIKTRHTAEKTIKYAARSIEKGIESTAKGTVKSAQKSVKTAERTAKTTERTAKTTIKTTQRATKAAQKAVQATEKAAKRTAQAARVAARKTERAVKIAVKAFIALIKASIAATKALVSAIVAGGWAVVLILLIVVLFGCFLSMISDGSSGTTSEVSAEVNAYEPLIRQYATEHRIPDYVELIKAVMMQESGGQGNDPMQASECGYNTKYPRTPGGITDPEYSIDVGIQNLAACLRSAGTESPIDIDNIKTALQGYNFGNGYISWAKSNYGGYTAVNAIEFSNMMAQRLGWDSYGDTQYVSNALRYYIFSGISAGTGVYIWPSNDSKYVTSFFGTRVHPIHGDTRQHDGIDIGAAYGTNVLAAASGTVTLAGWNGGYGNCVIIDHGNGNQTLYAHMSRLNVSAGQTVTQGQTIGLVGSTGNSTGPHLHFETYVNGSRVDPLLYFDNYIAAW